MDRGDYAWSIADSGFADDDSMLIRLRAERFDYHAQPPGACCTDHYVAVASRGTILVAVTSLGWEVTGGYPSAATYWAAQALARAQLLA